MTSRKVGDLEAQEKNLVRAAYLNPFERAVATVAELEAKLSAPQVNSVVRLGLILSLKIANDKVRIARDRSIGNVYPQFWKADAHRAGDGRLKYNARRRNVRREPNADRITPAELAAMSDEQLAAHRRAQKAKSAKKNRAKKALGSTQQ
jgi:hypothetical protein